MGSGRAIPVVSLSRAASTMRWTLSMPRTGRGKLQIQQCPKCPVSDGRPEKGGLSLRANNRRAARIDASAENCDDSAYS